MSNDIEKVAKKRGRKPKQPTEEKKDNIIVVMEESNDIINDAFINNTLHNNIIENNIENENNFLTFDNTVVEEPKSGVKKRGRKPKGGKIIQQIVPIVNNKESKPNIILHLKCSLKDLQMNTLMNTNIEGFHFPIKNNYTYEIIENNFTNNCSHHEPENTTHMKNTIFSNQNEYEYDEKEKENDIKEIWKKLKNLQHNLHINNINDKKSACFWCTYEFDSPPVYIPKYYMKESYHVYGCFCSPECATAYLMEESIDSSTKFERYHLINHIYSKIYNYNKNIKPAPNPYFMLEKFYGNLNIQEYRSLFKNERLFLVVDKPLTRILPELHEDNDDFIINNKIIPSNTYHINKKIQKKNVTKNNIMNEKFGLLQQ